VWQRFIGTEELEDAPSASGWQPRLNRTDGHTVKFKKRLDKEEKMKNKEEYN
jgi:hypothetical protein